MGDHAGSAGSNDVANAMSKAVSAHGHGFHYAVMHRGEELSARGRSYWVFDAAEFPVAVGGAVTHVDFVLRSRHGRTKLIAECKRADPARARWCFLKTPYTWRNAGGNELIFESVEWRPPNVASARAYVRHTSGAACNLAFELKTAEKGDGVGGRPSVTESAAQVLRSMNGLINHEYDDERTIDEAPSRTFFLPVIFTTAELWVSPADLREADIRTGNFKVSEASRVPWLWFNYNQSSALLHGLPRSAPQGNLADSLRDRYCRTIAIVCAEGVDGFLERDMDEFVGND